MELALSLRDVLDVDAGAQLAAKRLETLHQCPQQPQRADMAIHRAEHGPCHRRPDVRRQRAHARVVEHLERIVAADFDPDGGEIGSALSQLGIVEAYRQATDLRQLDIDAGAGGKFLRERGPEPRGGDGPSRIRRVAQSLALHPHEAEVAARGTEGVVAFVEQSHPFAGTRQAIGDRHADHAAADDQRVHCGGRRHDLPESTRSRP